MLRIIVSALVVLAVAAQSCLPSCSVGQYCSAAVGYGSGSLSGGGSPFSPSSSPTASPPASPSAAPGAGVCLPYLPIGSTCSPGGFKCGANPNTGDTSTVNSPPFVETKCINNVCCGIGCTGGCDSRGMCLDSCAWPPPSNAQPAFRLFAAPPVNMCVLQQHPGLAGPAPSSSVVYTCKLGFYGGGSTLPTSSSSVFYPNQDVYSDCVQCPAGSTSTFYRSTPTSISECECSAGSSFQRSPTGAISCGVRACPTGYAAVIIDGNSICYPSPEATNGLLGTILALMIICITTAALVAFGVIGGAGTKAPFAHCCKRPSVLGSEAPLPPQGKQPACGERVAALCKRPAVASAGTLPNKQAVQLTNPLVAGGGGLPPGWVESGPNETGQRWYTNSATGATQWERPTA